MNMKRLPVGNDAAGFSLIELLMVVVIVVIVTAISIPYLYSYKRLYRSEDQAIKVMDMMREASQLALTRRRVIRFEIDLTDNMAHIIDENGAAADTLIRRMPLDDIGEVRMDVIPTGVARPNPPDYNDAVFATDTRGHQRDGATITSHTVWQARFTSDGSVWNDVNTPINANLYIWPPLSPGNPAPRSRSEVRAITMFGGTGAVRYWKHNGTTFTASY